MKKRQNRAFDAVPYGYRIGRFTFGWLSRLTNVFAFLLFAILFAVASFWGNNWLKVQFIPGTISKTRVVAEVPFEYNSNVKTARLYEQKRQQSSSVFMIDERSYDEFIRAIKLLDEQIENFTYESILKESGREAIMDFVNEFMALNVIQVDWQDVALLVSSLSPVERAQIFQECISVLREIARDGVLLESLSFYASPDKSADFLRLKLKDGHKRNVRTLEEALHYIRWYLLSMDIDQDVVSVLFNILKQGVKPNLVYDYDESKANFNTILKSIRPVRVKIRQGDVILTKGMEIDAEVYETISAYRKTLQSINNVGYGFNRAFYPKMFLATLGLYIVIAALNFFRKIRSIPTRTLLICGVLVFLQLLLLRGFIQFCDNESISKSFLFVCSSYFLPPAICGSAIAMLLYGGLCGTVVSIVVSIYYTLMISKSIEFLMILLFANLIFLGLIRKVNFRVKIVRAGGISGMIVSLLVLFKDLVLFPLSTDKIVLAQSIASFCMCLGSGILTIIVLPIIERIFSDYSNITLLELTDYNNPILKQLQVDAPGTYNHSLLVSNIAEQVAMQVNANSIVCKTGALYHDIGKMLKAEYFIENQNNQINLHDKQTPYISVLVIKNHVKDGIELARKNNLPPVIVDAIKQHHGTTLMQYFYEKAKRDILNKAEIDGEVNDEINIFIANKVDSATFRYDGPRPQTKESLIIMLADSIEAASRTMNRINHQGIETLVNNIFQIKLSDHQFDECPVTFDEIRELKKAFIATVLAMMHSRISYNVMNMGSDSDSNQSNDGK